MKKHVIVVLAVAMVIAFSGTSAMAANSLQQGNISIGVGMGDSVFFAGDVVDLSARYLVTRDMAIVGGFGLRIDGGDADATYLSLTGGIRKYLTTDDFAPFFGGQLSIIMIENDVIGQLEDRTIFDLSAMFGAEYFIGKQFSVEGAVGVGFGQDSDDINNVDDTYFGTRTIGINANFYF